MKKKKKWNLDVAGIDPTGVPLRSGIFRMTDTYGLPLSMMVGILEKRGEGISWSFYILEAIEAGWKTETIQTRIHETFQDVYSHSDIIQKMENVQKIIAFSSDPKNILECERRKILSLLLSF